MKKITSFLMMAVLCCTGAFAQDVVGSDLPVNKLISIGTAQEAVEPGKWYFVHNSRPSSGGAQEFVAPGDLVPAAGGLVTDMGAGQTMRMSATTVIDELTSGDGVNANNYLKHMIRFVSVEGKTDVYKIEFGTGNWMGNNPNTITKNQHIAGESGEYNFYLVALDGTPNSLGRFGWNKFDMANRVDNNGAGNTVSFWSSGITDGVAEGWTTEDQIMGNRIWQIYDILNLGDVDLYAEGLMALLNEYTRIGELQDGAFIQNLIDGVNVGTSYGNYRQEDVDAFLEMQTKIEEVMFTWENDGQEALEAEFPTADDIQALLEAYTASYEKVINNKIPTAIANIVPGYYTINSMLGWYETKSDTVYLTKEEADSINNENGYLPEDSDDYVIAGGIKEIVSKRVDAPIKAMLSRAVGDGRDALGWGTLEPKAEYLWKVEAVEGKPTEYRLVNMYKGATFNNIGRGDNTTPLMVQDDTATVCFDWRGDDGVAPVTKDTVTYFNLRCAKHPENNLYYMHAGSHGGGAGVQGWIVGWSDGGATQWYLAPVDQATADEWMAEGNVAVVLENKIAKGDSIAAVVPAQIEIAKDIETTLHEADSVVVTADQFYSQYTTEDAQTIPEGQTIYDFLIDGKQNTYWHSAWESGAVGQKVHYLQIRANEALEGLYAVKLQRRPVSGDHITQLIVKGYTEEPTDETTFEEGTELGVLDFPLSSNNETLTSKVFDATGMNYLRFYSTTTATTGGGGANRGYWHASAFNVYKATSAKRYATVQADVRTAEIAALEAAVAAWEEKAFSADSLALATDPTFEAAYNTLLAAYEAWTAVYVDPTDLRSAINNAPDENLFVKGDNPGFWKEGAVTPKAAVDAAKAYNEAGAYTPAKSQEHIDAIAAAEEAVFESANKIETGKWYRFKFATEAMYDTYGWAKTGAQTVYNEVADMEPNPALFGKTIAVGKSVSEYLEYFNEDGEADTLRIYSVDVADEVAEGNGLYFFENTEFENGEDLFQFIPATDSTYMIQNKATGLFVRNGHPVTLGAIPAYFDVKAIGAGATIIGSTDIFGNHGNPLHGQRADNALVTWNATTLGSNSMMMIEEVEAVTDAPSTDFVKKMWPGKVNTYTYPVDITIGEGATAYGAELVVTEEDTTIVLKTIEAETIKAGMPFIAIADLDGEWITTTERLAQIADEVCEEEGQYGYNEKIIANERMDEEYVRVEMTHGMAVDTLVHGFGDLVGTMKQVTVEAGKGLVANENKFKHTLVNTTVGAYSAYIKSDFDPEGDDVLSGLIISFEGSIESGIDEVLNKVAQSGNIYTVGGQLVGKGNINTINNLPAGIYIVNGVKVTKK